MKIVSQYFLFYQGKRFALSLKRHDLARAPQSVFNSRHPGFLQVSESTLGQIGSSSG